MTALTRLTRRLSRPLTAIVIAALAATAALAMPRNIKLGDPLGSLKATDIDGRPIDSGAWSGAPVVWIFVSAEQASSERALKDLQAAVDELTGSKVNVVALTSDAVRVPYFREQRSRLALRFPLAIDTDRQQYGRLGVIVLPTTLIADKDGKLAAAVSGHDLSYRQTVTAHLLFLAGRINADEKHRRLTTTQPARDPARDRAERLCRSADVMLRRGLRREAATELQRAIEADAGYAPAYLQLARLKAGEEDFDTAEKLINDVRQREPGNRQAMLELGMIRFHQKRLDDAEKLLKESLILNPDPARTQYWLGRVYEARGQNDAAVVHYRAAAEAALPDLSLAPARRAAAQ